MRKADSFSAHAGGGFVSGPMKIILQQHEVAEACTLWAQKRLNTASDAVTDVRFDEVTKNIVAEVDFDHPDMKNDDLPL